MHPDPSDLSPEMLRRLARAEGEGLGSHCAILDAEFRSIENLVMETVRTLTGALSALDARLRRQGELARELHQAAPQPRGALLASGLAELEAGEQEITRRLHDMVRAFQCEDMLLQMLARCQGNLETLEARASLWRRAGEAPLEELLSALEALAPVRPCGAHGDSLHAGDIELF